MAEDHPLDPAAELAALLRSQRTLVLATANEKGEPLASYAPFLAADGALHVYLSTLSAHTPNFVRGAECGRTVSVMLIEDERPAHQIFARRRATLRCTVSVVPRGSERYQALMTRLRERFGVIMDTLAPLADFRLFALTPVDGNVVTGFGRASAIETERLAGVLANA